MDAKGVSTAIGASVLVAALLGCGANWDPADPALLTFKILPHEKPASLVDGRYLVGSIAISRSDTGEVVETIPVALHDPQVEWRAYGLRRDDMDFDGYADLGYMEHGGSKWGYLHWWIYDPRTGKFEWTPLSEELLLLTPANYRLDPTNKRLRITQFEGAALNEYVYEVHEGHLKLLEGPDVLPPAGDAAVR